MLAYQTRAAAEVGKAAGLSVIESSILGASAILFLLVAVVAVWRLSKVQDKRAEDAEKHSIRMEALADRMLSTISKFDKTIDKLVEAERASQETQRTQNDILLQMKQSQDTIIRDAVIGSRYRGSSRGPSTPPSSGG